MGDLPTVSVVRATENDLDSLARVLGHRFLFADLLRRQGAKLGVLLIARADQHPVGTVYVRWEPPDEPYLRRELPGTPLLNHLEVHQAYRRRGVATSLLDSAEDVIRREGYDSVALGVGLHNVDAIRLYTKRGYQAWRRQPIHTTTEVILDDGTRKVDRDRCWIFYKKLSDPFAGEPD